MSKKKNRKPEKGDAKSGGGFKSFADLARSRGGSEGDSAPDAPDAPDAAGAEDAGWTLESDDGAGALEMGGGARERILRRPPGFGAMEAGPPCYRDADSEEMELLASFRVRTLFPAEVQQEVASLPRDPRAADRKGRRDLRGETIFTIDGEDAKDFDDAIGMRELDGGRVELGVHIADVGHYVRPETALDAEALARATSIYLPDQVIPMLPEGLSNHLCSLVPERERLAYSVFMVFDAKGQRLEARVEKSVIQSVRRCTYAEVQQVLDGESGLPKDLRALETPLRLLQRWTIKQQELRDARGSLRIQSTEKRFEFDDGHQVSAIVDAPRYFSMTLIEETALAANQAVGDLFADRGLPTIYRVHPEKDPDEVAAVARMLAEHGVRVPDKERLTGRDVARMILAARRRPNAEALIGRIMGLVERAVYELRGADDPAGHFGLARRAYLHFTSPIRRYPDLIVHRWLHAVESRGEQAARELSTDALLTDLNDVAQHASAQAQLAEMAARAVGDLKICQYMEPHVGERIDSRVLRVSRAGLEVALGDYNVTGFLPARGIGDRVELKGPTIQISAGRRARSFTEGHPVTVRLLDVDFIRLQLRLELA